MAKGLFDLNLKETKVSNIQASGGWCSRGTPSGVAEKIGGNKKDLKKGKICSVTIIEK